MFIFVSFFRVFFSFVRLLLLLWLVFASLKIHSTKILIDFARCAVLGCAHIRAIENRLQKGDGGKFSDLIYEMAFGIERIWRRVKKSKRMNRQTHKAWWTQLALIERDRKQTARMEQCNVLVIKMHITNGDWLGCAISSPFRCIFIVIMCG